MRVRVAAPLLAAGVSVAGLAGLAPAAAKIPVGTGAPAQPLLVPTTIRVALVAQSGVTGVQRVNFAIPFPRGGLTAMDATRVVGNGAELPAARRVLATHPDGSIRSLQVQVDVNPATTPTVDVLVGTMRTRPPLALADVSTTLVSADGTRGPRVWAYVPGTWVATSGAAGFMKPRSAIAGTALDAWQVVCNCTRYDTTAFNAGKASASYWLYDRPTALYRGYAYNGTQSVFRDAYVEAAMYRAGITGTGSSTRIGVPGASGDLKYHYTQGMAIHYLLTGDVRFREAAENVAVRAHDLWPNPSYRGGFWTERHAGFALLAYEWAAAVSDDRAATFTGWSDVAVTAAAAMQDNASAAWETDARCFAHTAASHDEAYGYTGCSPWMSSILADGLDAYAQRVATGTKFTVARTALVELGRMIARHGRDSGGKPFYWMGAGVDRGEVDGYDEHWGESAYVVAMAWWYQGKTDTALRTAADQLVTGTKTKGETGQLRSFNWQCRSAMATPFFLS